MARRIMGLTVLALGLLGGPAIWAADFDAVVFRDMLGTVLAVVQAPAGQTLRADPDTGVRVERKAGVGPDFFTPYQAFKVEAVEGRPGITVYLNEKCGAALEYTASSVRLVVPDPTTSGGSGGGSGGGGGGSSGGGGR
jgi:uncharacterized membrane protein YgcG